MTKKAFLSYSHKDEEFVRALYHRLTADGVTCFFDQASIAWGSNWVLELEKGLKECDFIVLILTPEFCQSQWAQLERISILISDLDGRKRKIRPLLLKECETEMPILLQGIKYIDVSTREKFTKNYPTISQSLGGVPKLDGTTINRAQLPPLCALPAKKYMPLPFTT